MDDDFEEQIFQGISGIKKVKHMKKISRFKWGDDGEGLVSSFESEKVFVPGQGILEGVVERDIIYDCGHSSTLGLGHIGECGHAICQMCIAHHVLQCAHPQCFLTLCNVHDCDNMARLVSGVYFCSRHRRSALIGNIIYRLIFGSFKADMRIEAINRNYYLTGFQDEQRVLSDGK